MSASTISLSLFNFLLAFCFLCLPLVLHLLKKKLCSWGFGISTFLPMVFFLTFETYFQIPMIFVCFGCSISKIIPFLFKLYWIFSFFPATSLWLNCVALHIVNQSAEHCSNSRLCMTFLLLKASTGHRAPCCGRFLVCPFSLPGPNGDGRLHSCVTCSSFCCRFLQFSCCCFCCWS